MFFRHSILLHPHVFFVAFHAALGSAIITSITPQTDFLGTKLVLVIPHSAQVQKCINLPFFAVLYPDGSTHSVCFFCITQ